MKQEINIVWMKRDIRSQDHEPLWMADRDPLPYIIIYLFEPSLIQYPDTSLRHLQFQYHSIQEFNSRQTKTGKHIHLLYGEAEEIFENLQQRFSIQKMWSYQESGTMITWKRDKWVAQFCQKNNIQWTEFQRDGIVRGLKNRENWDKSWHRAILGEIIQNQTSKNCLQIDHHFHLDQKLEKELKHYPTAFQPAGEKNAWFYLKSFTEGRGNLYHKLLSKPTESRKSCSRLSPYLAWGNISVRQAFHYIKDHKGYSKNRFAFDGMLTRLKWHCHFIQKFEMECRYETHCVNEGYESLQYDNNKDFLNAWKEGKTGFPLVDACMRCLKETGWINFRMRAMLVSVLCHHLDIDWRLGAYHLSQLFLDYEPGIHYPQFQMQAGTTGVNIVRMYNPVKQSMEHDFEGIFIKKWLPELEKVPLSYLHEPWKITEMEQVFLDFTIGKDYPLPLVDLEKAGRIAREKIWGHKKTETVQKENQRIVKKHTRNKTKRKQ